MGQIIYLQLILILLKVTLSVFRSVKLSRQNKKMACRYFDSYEFPFFFNVWIPQWAVTSPGFATGGVSKSGRKSHDVLLCAWEGRDLGTAETCVCKS